ncbi:fimbrial protein [Serratia sp. JSRIV001]|uniref:fimbrial protein n=1 Tax=Serratia TaxID=613 RepID=UPI001C476444|nr:MULTISPECIES: fimbrial protein [Serratia]QXN60549.1 fimbrial protein [Serratia fonticola]UAN44791.1 fimbrial protein [Serratia sp. JSRIV001]UAN50282.1 fimbrial protein [Serratia sp. JSRIV002]UAN56238.1 fimbrial protein [Serratia sp. JSRIV004]CAI1031510.1 fimbrial protein [Serratia fonticola]
MKKNLLVAALMTAGVLSASAFAADGKINFVGAITDDACTVVNDMSNPLTVTLGTVSSKAFTTIGSTAAPTKFTIALTNCPATMTSAKVKFDGTADANEGSILALTQEAGVATNVGIQLTDKANVVVPLYTASSSYALVPGANNLDFVARYYSTAASVTAGPANSTSNFTIIYN